MQTANTEAIYWNPNNEGCTSVVHIPVSAEKLQERQDQIMQKAIEAVHAGVASPEYEMAARALHEARMQEMRLATMIRGVQCASQPAPSRQGIRLPTKEQAAQAAMIVADDGPGASPLDPLGQALHPHARNMCECGVFVPIIDRIVQAGLCRKCWMEQDFELSQDFRCIDMENALAAVDRAGVGSGYAQAGHPYRGTGPNRPY